MWMNLERTVLSKVSQKERKEHRTILCKVKKHSNKYPKATEPKNWSLAETNHGREYSGWGADTRGRVWWCWNFVCIVSHGA